MVHLGKHSIQGISA